MRRTAPLCACIVVGLSLFLDAARPGSGAVSPGVHQIVIEKMAFGAPPQAVHVGDTIVWTNKDIFRHSTTADDMSFDVGIEPNSTARIVMQRAGTFRYLCKYHPSMTSELIVEK